MGVFDELISHHGVIVAGRIGPDWRVAEHKSKGLFMEDRAAFDLVSSFAAAIQIMFNTMALAMRGSAVDWQPVKGWAVESGPYSLVLKGDRFMLAETEHIDSFDELRHLLQETKP